MKRLLALISLVLTLLMGWFMAAPQPAQAQTGNQNVELVNQIGGDINAIAIQGKYAYVGEGYRLTILDITDPANPIVVGKSPNLSDVVQDVYLSGNIAYVTSGKELQLINISNPTNPILVGHYSASNTITDMAIGGDYVYLAAGNLVIVNVSNPTMPTLAASYGVVDKVAIGGHYIYTIHGGSDLRIIDISDPNAPLLVSSSNGYYASTTLEINGSYAYELGGLSLQITNISNPLTPIVASVYTYTLLHAYYDPSSALVDHAAFSGGISGHYAYQVGYNGVEIIDISDPINPVLAGIYTSTFSYYSRIVIHDGYAYITQREKGLDIINLTDLTHPILVGRYGIGNGSNSIISSNYLYSLANNPATRSLKIFDVSNPMKPVLTNSYNIVTDNDFINNIAIDGSYAYLVTGRRGTWAEECYNVYIEVVDISNPAVPTFVSSYRTASGSTPSINYRPGPTSFGIQNKFGYLVGQGGLEIINFSNLTDPTLAGSYYDGSYIFNVSVSGKYALLSGRIIDISKPFAPVRVGTLLNGNNTILNGVYAYEVSNYGLRIFNISHPTNTEPVGSYQDTDYNYFIRRFAVDSNYVYMVGQKGLKIINVANPKAPVLAGNYDMLGATDVVVGNDYIYVMEGSGGMSILKFTPPITPTLSLSKSADKQTVQWGDTVNYSVVLTSDLATSVSLTDTLPFGLEVVMNSLPQGLSYDTTTRQLRYTGLVSSPLQFNYQAQVAQGLARGSALYNGVEVTTGSGQNQQWQGAAVTVVIPDPTFTQTLALFYLGVDNNLDKAGTEAIIRLRQSCQANAQVKCWVMVDWQGAANSYLYRFDNSAVIPVNDLCPTAFDLYCGGRLTLGQQVWSRDENSTSPYSLAQAMIAMTRAYPNARNADQLIVSLIGHGGGFSNQTLLTGQPQKHDYQSGGLLYEENPLSVMSLQDLRQALTLAQAQTGHKIGLLYLDMCLMSNLESLHELTGLADYVLASPNWAFAAFPYDKHIQAIDGRKEVRAIGQAWLNNQVSRLSYDQYPYTFSLIDMAKLPSLVAATEQLAQALLSHSQTDEGRAKIRQARADSECFDSDQNRLIDTADHLCDLGSFALKLQGQFRGDNGVQGAGQAILTALTNVLIQESHNQHRLLGPYPWSWSSEVKGISLFTPFITPVWQLAYYNDYELKFAETTAWDTLLTHYWSGTTPPALPQSCNSQSCFPPIEQTTTSMFLLMPHLMASPNTTVTVPINAINMPVNSCLEAVNVTLQYDANIATFVKARAAAAMTGATLTVNSNQPGLLRIVGNVTNCQPFAGSGTLFNVTFQVKGAISHTMPLNFLQGLTQTALYDQKDLLNALNLTLVPGYLTVAQAYIRGDVTGDGLVNAADGSLALRHTLGKITLDNIAQNACNVNGDSRCNEADVSLIRCYVAYQDWSFCQQRSSTALRALQATPAQTVSLCLWPIMATGTQTLSLKVAGAPDLAGGYFSLHYDPSQVTVHAPIKTNLTSAFALESHEAVSGELRIALANENPLDADGYLFQLPVTAHVPTATVTMSEIRLNNRVGQDFETNLQRSIKVTTCKMSSLYLPLITR